MSDEMNMDMDDTMDEGTDAPVPTPTDDEGSTEGDQM